MKKSFLIVFVFPLLAMSQEADQQLNRPVSKIAFGSCSHQTKVDQQLWKEVNATQADLWIWLGDNIYGDSEDMEVMRTKYESQKSHPDYQQLLQNTAVLGIWDDHDYGVNDGGKEYPMKDESKEELFRFLDVSPDHPARDRKGAYQSYAFSTGRNTVKLILLDTRYFRDLLAKDEKNWNIPNETGEILGDQQWKWFEDQLNDPSIDFFLIASGIQVIPTAHRFEKWANFPQELDRFYNVISKLNKPALILSGDRHISEVSKTQVENYPFPLYELTSSSLTNPWGEPRDEPNPFREKSIVYDVNFALLELDLQEEASAIRLSYIGTDNTILQTHDILLK